MSPRGAFLHFLSLLIVWLRTMVLRRRVALLVVSLVAACTHEPAPGESVTEVCQVAHNGTEVSVSGYLLPPILTFGCVDSCGINLTPSKQERYGIGLSFPVGHGPRTMAGIEPKRDSPYSPNMEELSTSAYRLTDDNGKELGPGDVARVTGTLSAVQHDGEGVVHCSLSPDSVQGL